ncbi:sigma-54 dependent transcriptional regulator [Luteitalea sp. TBR-22]|uniref:sigma-54-dependent transcriptional regulator n=1 Tax=Luteitalea sp. TBR-22 TaxID=2802971 RepID=UPI001EF5ADFB|nr:sigma-54 dependent transcriptional regulator [Luteitalea sp. TBR-22]
MPDAPLRLLAVGAPDSGIRIGLDRFQERHVVELRMADADGVEAAAEAWAPDVLLVIGSGRAADGPEALRTWRQRLPETDAVVVRPLEDAVRAAEWLRVGAFAVVNRPVEADELAEELDRAAERVRLRAENRQLRRQLEAPQRFPAIIGQSKKMLELLELVAAVAGSDANILVLGENGTGKELIANAVHAQSARAPGPFIKINCAALPKELIEAELFGYRRGAFTGAFTDKAGLLAMAEGGSLLLDEIGEMPSYLQAKLLRVLQEREFRPIGSDRSVRVDFRLICATNVDVEAALREGRLREDLYFRINTITARVPALRERLEDLPPLCQHFLALYNARHGRQLRGVSPTAYHRLMQHRWPGNVRELENVIERGVLVARGQELQPDDLPETVTAAAAPAGASPDLLPATATLAEIERMAILQALQRTNWNKQDAAQQLGLYRPTLYSKMKKHGITSPPRPRRRVGTEAPTESPA